MSPRRVLVVDDDDGIRDFVRMALSDDGYDVATAADGAEAIETARGFEPHLVVLDVRMVGMDGVEFARAYRDVPGRAPILVFTAARDPETTAREMGADAFLAKPFELKEFLELVARLSGRSAR
jgi:two-component system phosphate regulon response regulator OmpR